MALLAAMLGIVLIAAVIGIGGAERWLMPAMDRRRNSPRVERTRRQRWVGRAIVTAWAIVSAVAVWALGEGHTAVGIGLLVGVFILPEFVLVPIHITQSRRRAAEARARREANRS